MSIQEKIDNAQPTTWLTDGIPKWKVRLLKLPTPKWCVEP